MALSINGLSEYNPLYILNTGYPTRPCNQYLDIFMYSDKDILYDMDIYQLMHERMLLCEIYTKVLNDSNYTMDRFVTNFQTLIGNLLSTECEEFWNYFYVLQEIICKVSSVNICRQIIVDNLDSIHKVFNKAIAKERSIPDFNNRDKLGFSFMLYFVINKFKPNSDADDDELADGVIKQAYGNNIPPFNVIELISLYKNCNRFDITLQDLLIEYEFCSKQDYDYFWIYTPYLIKYLSNIEAVLMQTLGEDLYDYWIRMLMNQKSPDYSEALKCKQIFDASDVLTYDSDKLLSRLRGGGKDGTKTT